MTESPRDIADRISRNIALVRNSPYVPLEPTDLQWAFLCDDREEILFGGGTGGGKSWALLAAALMYVHVPGYSAVIFRKTFPDLMMPSGMIPLAAQWLTNTDARKHDGGKKWSFPSGATLTFAHLENPQDRFKYAGLEAQFIGWDEVAQMEFVCYEFLQSRMRRSVTNTPELEAVPMRVRSTANPGHKEALWVKEYFVSAEDGTRVNEPGRLYIHSTLEDNPHLVQEEYAAKLDKLGPLERAQMRHGDWAMLPSGNMFSESNFARVPGKIRGPAHRVRAWDLAGSAKTSSDFCAGVLMARDKVTGEYRIEHVVHEKLEPGPLEKKMRATAELDGQDVVQLLEEERSGSGKLVTAHMRRTVLKGFKVRSVRPVGDKVSRAGLLSALVDRNEVDLTVAAWNDKFVSELVGFPGGRHDDMVDAAAMAAHFLARLPVKNQPATAREVGPVAANGYGSGGSPPGRKAGGFVLGGAGTRGGLPPGGMYRGLKRSPFGAEVGRPIRER